jgi:GDPmannose 4,6-dehydratase
MNILITGASGQDGVFLTQKILSECPESSVVAVSRSEERFYSRLQIIGGNELLKSFSTRGAFLPYDISSKHTIKSVLERYNFDVVFHLAATVETRMTEGSELTLMRDNLNGLVYLLQACDELKISPHIINAGSSLMIGFSHCEIVDEDTPLNPETPYGIGKTAGYQFAKMYRKHKGQKVSNAILFNHESIFRSERWLPTKIIKGAIDIKRGLKTELHLDSLHASRDWSAAEDIVDGMFKIMKSKSINDDFMLGSGKLTSVKEIVEFTFSYLGLNWRDHVISKTDFEEINNLGAIVPELGKAKKCLDWSPRQETDVWLKKIIQYHNSSGHLSAGG